MGGLTEIRLPRSVPRGGTVGICAPAGPVERNALREGIAWLEREGYRVRCAPHLHARSGYLAGPDAERLSDLTAMVRDPGIDAILLARGGYGVGRILRELDADEIRESGKLFCGYSDATLFLLFLRERAGLAAIHGPMLDRTDTTAEARARLLQLFRGAKEGVAPLAGRALSGGGARGPLVGGNLSLVVASLGTPWEVDTNGAILFLEEVDEAPYRIDRMLVQLRDAGKLDAAAGVALGNLVGSEGERYPDPTAGEVVRELLVPEVRGPVVMDLPFGHVADNRALAVGVDGQLDGEAGTLALLGRVVEGTG